MSHILKKRGDDTSGHFCLVEHFFKKRGRQRDIRTFQLHFYWSLESSSDSVDILFHCFVLYHEYFPAFRVRSFRSCYQRTRIRRSAHVSSSRFCVTRIYKTIPVGRSSCGNHSLCRVWYVCMWSGHAREHKIFDFQDILFDFFPSLLTGFGADAHGQNSTKAAGKLHFACILIQIHDWTNVFLHHNHWLSFLSMDEWSKWELVETPLNSTRSPALEI